MTKIPKWLRPSSLPRLSRCPASGVSSEGMPDATNSGAARGRAWHEIAAILVKRGQADAASAIQNTALRHAVPAADLRKWLRDINWKADPGAVAHAERSVLADFGSGVEIVGTADLVLVQPGAKDGPPTSVEVVDWKTGDPDYADDDQWLQIEVYAVGVAQETGSSKVWGSLCYVQLGEDGWRHLQIDVAEATERIRGIASRALNQVNLEADKREYRTGDHCRFCPARATCAARNTELRMFVNVLENHDGGWVVTAENAAALLDRSKTIERATKAVSDAVRDFVMAHGPIPAGEGRELRVIEIHKGAYTVRESTQHQLRTVKIGGPPPKKKRG